MIKRKLKTLMESLTPDIEFNLSQQSLFVDMARDPSYLENHLNAKLPKGGTVLIDEVQRIPSLLNTVQYLIDKKKGFQFLLTGSSARKLKRGKANLLPGRIHSYELGPLTAGVPTSTSAYPQGLHQTQAFSSLTGARRSPILCLRRI